MVWDNKVTGRESRDLSEGDVGGDSSLRVSTLSEDE